MHRCEIRLALLEEAEFLCEVERSAAQAFRTLPELAWIADADVLSAETHRQRIAANTVWVATGEAAGPIGFLSAEIFGDDLHLWEISVRREAQGQGHGRALLANAIADAKRRGLRAVTLTTFSNVPWNRPFYETLGFRCLFPNEMGSRLSQILQNEREHGLAHTPRCAMRLDI